MSISTGIGEVNNKVISQALFESVSQGGKGSIQEGSSWLIMIESHGLLHKLRVWISNHGADCFLSCASGVWQKMSDYCITGLVTVGRKCKLQKTPRKMDARGLILVVLVISTLC